MIKTLPVLAVGIVTSPAPPASLLRWEQPQAAPSSSVHWSALNRNGSLAAAAAAAVSELQTAHVRLSLWIVTPTLMHTSVSCCPSTLQ